MKLRKGILIFIGLVAAVLYMTTSIGANCSDMVTNVAYSNPTFLKNHVQFLTSTEKPRNHRNIETLNNVADYIHKEFSHYCESVLIQPYKVAGLKYKNVICIFPGRSKERIVVGAHYDVEGEQHGADDNASGVAGILELARLLKDRNLNQTIEIVAYTLEEPPHFATQNMGSYVHAQSFSETGIKVKLMLSLEMIGFFSDEKDSQSFPLPGMGMIYGDVGDFISVVGNMGDRRLTQKVLGLMRAGSPLRAESINAPSLIPGIDYSDHRSYWEFGYPALMITDTSFYRNPNYHEPTDTIETLDFKRMGQVVDGVLNVVLNQ